MTTDHINPDHYKSTLDGVECDEVSSCYNFRIGNVWKYIWRYGHKAVEDPLEDLRKAMWYLGQEAERNRYGTYYIGEPGRSIINKKLLDHLFEPNSPKRTVLGMILRLPALNPLDYSRGLRDIQGVIGDWHDVLYQDIEASKPKKRGRKPKRA